MYDGWQSRVKHWRRGLRWVAGGGSGRQWVAGQDGEGANKARQQQVAETKQRSPRVPTIKRNKKNIVHKTFLIITITRQLG